MSGSLVASMFPSPVMSTPTRYVPSLAFGHVALISFVKTYAVPDDAAMVMGIDETRQTG